MWSRSRRGFGGSGGLDVAFFVGSDLLLHLNLFRHAAYVIGLFVGLSAEALSFSFCTTESRIVVREGLSGCSEICKLLSM